MSEENQKKPAEEQAPAQEKPPAEEAKAEATPEEPKPQATEKKIQAEDLDFVADSKAAFLQERMPLANILLLSVALFVTAFVIWAANSEVTEITRGHGKVIPSGSKQIVQSLEGGIISEILISEGQTVEEGDPLIRIDDTAFSASYRENMTSRNQLIAKIARLDAEAKGLEEVLFPEHIYFDRPDLVESETQLFKSRRSTYFDTIENLKKSLELKEEELDITRPLAESGIVSKVELLRLETAANDLKGRLLKAKTDYDGQVLAEKSDNQAQLNQLNELIHAYEDKVTRTIVRSPTRGIVNKVHFNTIGGVIPPSAPIAEIVPIDKTLLVEAKIKPSDIAFIHPEHKAIVKLTAYDFSIYGGLEGVIEHISADTIVDEQGESFYNIRVRTGERSLHTGTRDLDVLPGMVVEVDIMTGKKSILDYLLKPLFRAKMNSFTER